MPQKTKGGARFVTGMDDALSAILQRANEIRRDARRDPIAAQDAADEIRDLVQEAFQYVRGVEPLLERQAPQYERRLTELEQRVNELETERERKIVPLRKAE